LEERGDRAMVTANSQKSSNTANVVERSLPGRCDVLVVVVAVAEAEPLKD